MAECLYYLLKVMPVGRFLVADDLDVAFSHVFLTNDDGNLMFCSEADMQWFGRMYLMSYEAAGLDKPELMAMAFDVNHVLCRSYAF